MLLAILLLLPCVLASPTATRSAWTAEPSHYVVPNTDISVIVSFGEAIKDPHNLVGFLYIQQRVIIGLAQQKGFNYPLSRDHIDPYTFQETMQGRRPEVVRLTASSPPSRPKTLTYKHLADAIHGIHDVMALTAAPAVPVLTEVMNFRSEVAVGIVEINWRLGSNFTDLTSRVVRQ